MISMCKRCLLFIFLLFLFSCSKDTVFNGGLENRVTALIDMVPESHHSTFDFTSDAQVSDCSDHDILYIDELEDGSFDNKIFKITLEARDYFRTANNCNDYDWHTTPDEELDHKFVITAFVEEINETMHIVGSSNVFHQSDGTNGMLAYYKLKQNSDGDDNNGAGIEYYGFNAEIEMKELNFSEGTASGVFNATLYRASYVANPSNFEGVDSSSDVDLFDPTNGDLLGDVEDGIIDSIRIENGVFQRVTLINNTSSY